MTDDIDTDRVDDAVLALLLLVSSRAGKAKSVVFTDKGLERAEALFEEMFAKAR